jgi:hypothetical protein
LSTPYKHRQAQWTEHFTEQTNDGEDTGSLDRIKAAMQALQGLGKRRPGSPNQARIEGCRDWLLRRLHM